VRWPLMLLRCTIVKVQSTLRYGTCLLLQSCRICGTWRATVGGCVDRFQVPWKQIQVAVLQYPYPILQDAVHLACDGGRVCRPLIICDAGLPRVTAAHMQAPVEMTNTRDSI